MAKINIYPIMQASVAASHAKAAFVRLGEELADIEVSGAIATCNHKISQIEAMADDIIANAVSRKADK